MIRCFRRNTNIPRYAKTCRSLSDRRRRFSTALTMARRLALILLLACVVGDQVSGQEPDDVGVQAAEPAARRPPNIVLILADDLGYAELGCYGQTKIRTPRLDALAAEGMRFTQAYSGSPVCAPSRCVLLTGLHTGHSFIRNNSEQGGWGPDAPEGQRPIPDATITLAERLKAQGYATGAFGKWGLGGPGSSGHPCYQGFDRFYGLLCQRVAHNYCPTHLWDNHDVDILGNAYFSAHQKLTEPLATEEEYYERFLGPVYGPDRMIEEALEFVDDHREEPFFLYFATPVPHVSLQVPLDSLAEYEGEFDEEPYLGQRSYLPHPKPRSAYAAMISRMDRDLGQLFDRLEQHGLTDDTIVIFTSDNGPTSNGGSDSAFFESAADFRGLKVDVYEGGIRVPLIVRWPGHIEPGSESELPVCFQDFTPTLLEAIGAAAPGGTDGISMLPTWVGDSESQRVHDVLYWELGRQQAVRAGDWKLVRITDREGLTRTELFNLRDDPNETTNLAEMMPDVLAWMLTLSRTARTPSEEFPSVYDDGR